MPARFVTAYAKYEQPAVRRESGHREYAIFFDGLVWMFLVASHRPDDAIPHSVIQRDGSFPIGYYNVLDSPNWVQAAREVALRNQEGVERLRRKSKAKASADRRG